MVMGRYFVAFFSLLVLVACIYVVVARPRLPLDALCFCLTYRRIRGVLVVFCFSSVHLVVGVVFNWSSCMLRISLYVAESSS